MPEPERGPELSILASGVPELGLLARVFMTQNWSLADKTGAQFWATRGAPERLMSTY